MNLLMPFRLSCWHWPPWHFTCFSVGMEDVGKAHDDVALCLVHISGGSSTCTPEPSYLAATATLCGFVAMVPHLAVVPTRCAFERVWHFDIPPLLLLVRLWPSLLRAEGLSAWSRHGSIGPMQPSGRPSASQPV